MADVLRYRHDDLRSFASALAAGVGVAPTRASALATHLLWFDAAGAASLGIATLADLLDRLESRSIDPAAEGSVISERASTTILDGRNGISLLLLARAGALASEKARDTGVGLVRVRNLGPTGSAAGVAAEMAIGPVAALIGGPGSRSAVALPSPEGLPVVFDPAIGKLNDPDEASAVESIAAPWLSVLAPDGGWLVAAVAVNALEPLGTFHERVADALKGLDESAGRLLPASWEGRRRGVREQGVAVEAAAWDSLLRRAERFGVEPPAPIT